MRIYLPSGVLTSIFPFQIPSEIVKVNIFTSKFIILFYFEARSHKSLKAPVSFVMSVCPSLSVRSVSSGRIFVKFDMGELLKSVDGIQIWLK